MLNGLLEIFDIVKSIGTYVWTFLSMTPGELYDMVVKGPLTTWSQEFAYSLLDNSLGGGDRNPFNEWAYAILDDTVINWTEALLQGPSSFFHYVLDYPIVGIIFGYGLLVALLWRLVSWVIDILP